MENTQSSTLNSKILQYTKTATTENHIPVYHIPVLGLFPARMRDISKPRLNAWLNMSLVWNVDIKGNQEKNAIGMNTSMPIPAS